MKKSIITSILALAAIAGYSQTKTPTPIIVSQVEAGRVINSLSKGLQIIHKLDIPALKRDSIDAFIGIVSQFMDERSKLALKADTAKVDPKKKP